MIRLSCVSKPLEADIKIIENFVVLMYDASCPHTPVYDCLKYLFSKLNRTIDECPRTKDALEQHILEQYCRVIFDQRAHNWKKNPSPWLTGHGMLTSGGESIQCGQHYRKLQRHAIQCGQHYRKLQRHAKSWKIASAKICGHMTYVLVELTPDHALSFAYVTVFARTDITSSMIKFVERGYSETCFSFDCTYINRPSYILIAFLLAIYASCNILYAFFQYFSLPAYDFYRCFCETDFLWNSFTSYF